MLFYSNKSIINLFYLLVVQSDHSNQLHQMQFQQQLEKSMGEATTPPASIKPNPPPDLLHQRVIRCNSKVFKLIQIDTDDTIFTTVAFQFSQTPPSQRSEMLTQAPLKRSLQSIALCKEVHSPKFRIHSLLQIVPHPVLPICPQFHNSYGINLQLMSHMKI